MGPTGWITGTVIHSLVRKPGAFRRYVFPEALFPSVTFRRCYDELVARSSGWADLEYVRILPLAAMRQETEVEACLVALLSEGVVPEYETVKARIEPAPTPLCPEVQLLLPDRRVYDALLENQGVAL